MTASRNSVSRPLCPIGKLGRCVYKIVEMREGWKRGYEDYGRYEIVACSFVVILMGWEKRGCMTEITCTLLHCNF